MNISKINIVSIIGARPQFVKHATFQRYLDLNSTNLNNQCIHTGQHYDAAMTSNICQNFQINEPDIILQSDDHKNRNDYTSMIVKIKLILIRLRPNYVILYGDTNSTLAGCLAANSLSIPIVHVESGLRSYDMRMPEERNRVITDRLSQYLIVPSIAAEENLIAEGFPHSVNVLGKNIEQTIHNFGDIMFDSYLQLKNLFESNEGIYKNHVLLTLHREQLFVDREYYQKVIQLVRLLAKNENVLFPAHPRVFNDKKLLYDFRDIGIKVIPALNYLDMQNAIANAKFVVTDSGGLQKEAFFHKKFCITLRENTEWIETTYDQQNQVVGACFEKFAEALRKCQFWLNNSYEFKFKPIYGDGKFCNRLVNLLLGD